MSRRVLIFVLSLPLWSFISFGAEIPGDLVKGLSSEKFRERESAQDSVLEWAAGGGEEAASAVYDLREGSDDPEVRERCGKVLRSLSDLDYLSDGKGYLGIQMLEETVDLPDDDKPRFCVRVTAVIEDGPASEAGLKDGDLITALNEKKWYDIGAVEGFINQIADSKPMDKVVLTIIRKNQDPANSVDITVTLGRRPVDDLSRVRGAGLRALDEKARNEHFRKWLKKFELRE